MKTMRMRCQLPVKRKLLDESYPGLCDDLLTLERDMNNTICDETKWLLRNLQEDENGTNTDKLNRLFNSMHAYASENVALVNIFIKDPYVTRLKRDEAFPIIVFVAGFGGLFGVFTGFSFISGVEIIYYLGKYITKKCKPNRRSISDK